MTVFHSFWGPCYLYMYLSTKIFSLVLFHCLNNLATKNKTIVLLKKSNSSVPGMSRTTASLDRVQIGPSNEA